MAKWTFANDSKEIKQLKVYPDLVRKLLVNRGVYTDKGADLFFNPVLQNLYSPSKLFGMNEAVKAIISAVLSKKKIFIHGDFDVDGVCAVSILWDFVYNYLGGDILPFIPDRFDEGYGMSDKTLQKIYSSKGELVITVDCGVKDLELIKKWHKKGLDFIVTDHHTLFEDEDGNPSVPKDAIAVVHPNHPKGNYPFKEISGAAVVWKVIVALIDYIKLNYKGEKIFEKADNFDPCSYLDLVSIATVCDIMPLIDENRILVANGLKRFQNTSRIGLVKLLIESGINSESIDTYHLGFILGPRLNAAGRLGHALDAVRLLTTKSVKLAEELAKKLSDLNAERQKLTQSMLEEARNKIMEIEKNEKLYFAWGENWHKGVVGLVAGKLTEEFNRPVIIGSKEGDEITASARSISSFNITSFISESSDILVRFGGHAQAAGLTVHQEKIELFKKRIQDRARENISDSDIEGEYLVDAPIELSDINWEMMEWLEKFKPYGFGNRAPVFVLEKIPIAAIDFIGRQKEHLRIAFINKETGEYISCIGFYMAKDFPNLKIGDTISALFSLEVNEWNGEKRIQLRLKDIKLGNR